MKLVLGVIDVPYPNSSEGITTGDVAEILEKKYGLMQGFVGLHLGDMADDLKDSYVGAIQALMAGAPPTIDPAGTGTQKIAQQFKFEYLDQMEAEHANLGPGLVPTKAALKGVNHRLKSGKGARRPSFIDTGLLQANMMAWLEEDGE